MQARLVLLHGSLDFGVVFEVVLGPGYRCRGRSLVHGGSRSSG